jgi:N-methylhydantoinase B/oxoprolinase/acetone carboxylase alpha subunit
MTVEADEITVSALFDRAKNAPWGLFGGLGGERAMLLVRLAGSERFQTFSQAFGTISDSKFANVRLHRGDTIVLRSPSGGGYGPPHERPVEKVLDDVRNGFVSVEAARDAYGVVIDELGAVDGAATAELRA